MTLFLFTHFIFALIIILGDNMKVYMVEKDVRKSIGFLFIILLIFIFLIYGSFVLSEADSFLGVFEGEDGSITFFVTYIISLISLVFVILKPARKYVGKLIKKEKTVINDKECYLLTFEVEELYLREMSCYTKKENPFEVGKKYNMSIKEVSGKIKKIDTEVVLEEKQQSTFSRIINHPLTLDFIYKVIIFLFMFSLVLEYIIRGIIK